MTAPSDPPAPPAWAGGMITRSAECVLAPNPGPMTLDGTNTWVLAAPGARHAVVVDPGPDDEAHLAAVVGAAARRDAQVALVLLTHGHVDHAEGATRLAGLTGAPVRALDPAQRLGGEGLVDGDVVEVGGLRIDVVATPGHTPDSLSFLLSEDGGLLTGDTVLGRGSTVVAHPDGSLADYLASLGRIDALAQRHPLAVLLPGHGPALHDPRAAVQWYLAHRRQRLEQVRAARDGGATDPAAVVAQVYADVDPALWPAAELSVAAQLAYLADGG